MRNLFKVRHQNEIICIFPFVALEFLLWLSTCFYWLGEIYPASIYLFQVKNESTRTRCQISSKLTIKTSERREWRCSAVFITNTEYIPQLVLTCLLLSLNRQMFAGYLNDPTYNSNWTITIKLKKYEILKYLICKQIPMISNYNPVWKYMFKVLICTPTTSWFLIYSNTILIDFE